MTPKGEVVPGEDRQRWGGDRSSTTRETKASGDSNKDKEMTIRPGMMVPSRPQQGMAAGRCSEVRPYRHTDGANGARPKRVSEYGLLPDAAKTQVSGNGYEAAMRTGGLDARETLKGDQSEKCASSVRHARGLRQGAETPQTASRA